MLIDILVGLQAPSAEQLDSLQSVADSLRGVAGTLKKDQNAWTEWAALTIAFVAVFFGPLLQYWITKQQIAATVLSGNRQKWIDNLRLQLAEFMAVAVETNLHLPDDDDMYYVNIRPSMARLRAIEFQIILALNPKEGDHRKLAELLQQTGIRLSSVEHANEKPLGPILEEIRSLSQSILKREWERVKTLK